MPCVALVYPASHGKTSSMFKVAINYHDKMNCEAQCGKIYIFHKSFPFWGISQTFHPKQQCFIALEQSEQLNGIQPLSEGFYIQNNDHIMVWFKHRSILHCLENTSVWGLSQGGPGHETIPSYKFSFWMMQHFQGRWTSPLLGHLLSADSE